MNVILLHMNNFLHVIYLKAPNNSLKKFKKCGMYLYNISALKGKEILADAMGEPSDITPSETSQRWKNKHCTIPPKRGA